MKLDRSIHSVEVRLDVESRPESLTLVRSLLAAIGDVLTLDAEFMDDLRTAVSEACNNVVLHAYESETGPLTVSLRAVPEGLQVLVRDSGGGMHRVSARADRMGVGIAVIGALADRMEFRSNSTGGTDVRMWFTSDDADPDAFPESELWPREAAPLTGDIVVSLEPVELLAPVLGRLTRAAAAQSRFTSDGIAEIAGVTDSVAAYAAELSTSQTVDFSLSTTTRRLELTAGPFSRLELVANEGGSKESAFTVNDDLERPTFESQGDRKMLRTVIVDERVSA